MAIGKQKTEGGQGGLRGHSNMSHWDYTENVKIATRKHRRLESKVIITKAFGEEIAMVDDNMKGIIKIVHHCGKPRKIE